MESSQMTTISPHPPSYGSFSTSASGGRHGAVVCPHLVGVTTPKDLELLGVLPGHIAPDRGHGHGHHSSATIGARESMMSMFSSYMPRGGLRAATIFTAVRGDRDGRRHDVSYLRDTPGHGKQAKQGDWSDVNVPPTKIPRDGRMVEKSILKKCDPSFEEWYDPAERLWHRIVFPAKRPSNREQVLLLERWMTKMLATHADNAARSATKNNSPERTAGDQNDKQRLLEQAAHMRAESNMSGKIRVTGKGEGGPAVRLAARVGGVAAAAGERQAGVEGMDVEGVPEVEEKEAAMIRAQMSVLMLGFYEIVRQVTQHCAERGRLLDRIWRSLNDLFEYVLKEMADTVIRCERKLATMSKALERERTENDAREATHSHELQMVEELHNGRWSKKMRQIREQELQQGKLAAANERTVDLLRDWLPNFEGYADSVLAKLLPPRLACPEGVVVETLQPQDALEKDLRRIQSAGLWAIVPRDEPDAFSESDECSASSFSSNDDELVSDRSDSEGSFVGNDAVRGYPRGGTTEGGAAAGGGRRSKRYRSKVSTTMDTTCGQGRSEIATIAEERYSEPKAVGSEDARGSQEQRQQQQQQQQPNAPQVASAVATVTRSAPQGSLSAPEEDGLSSPSVSSSVQPQPLWSVADVATVGKVGQTPWTPRGNGRKAKMKNLMAVLMKQGQEATAQADALRREVAEANVNASSIASRAKKDALQLVQACGRAQGAILSLLADPTPCAAGAFPGLLQVLGMTAVTEHVSIIRANPPLGVAGVHYAIVSATRALLTFRREAAVAATTHAATAAPAVGSMSRRRLAEFLYETELRRSGKAGTARAALRKLLASLLFWSPLQADDRNGKKASAGSGGGGDGPAPRLPGYGKLPRPMAGHERTAFTQFQALLFRGGLRSSTEGGAGGGRGDFPEGDEVEDDFDIRGDGGGGGAGSSTNRGGDPFFSDAEECLWLRLFAAVEAYARPCRTEPHQGPTKPELVPLEKAVSAVHEVLGQGPEAAAAAAADPRSSAHGLARRKKTKGGGWDEALRRGSVANPWLLVDHAALDETVATLKTAAAKHGGSHVELFDITEAALTVGYRANRATLVRVISLVAQVADLAGELTFGAISVIMHIASPVLPEAALRLLFYRAVTMRQAYSSRSRPQSAGGGDGGNIGVGERTSTIFAAGDVGISPSAGRARAGGGGGVQAVTPAALARAVVEFPLVCEGLAPLIHAVASVHGVRELLKQAVYQAKEAVEEAEKTIQAIKDARIGTTGGKCIGSVTDSEVEAVLARTSQLKAFVTNAETTRSALDASKVWISRRMLVTETALLRAYGGILPTVQAQDAIRQGRRVRMRYVLRRWQTAWREKLISRPSEADETTGEADTKEANAAAVEEGGSSCFSATFGKT